MDRFLVLLTIHGCECGHNSKSQWFFVEASGLEEAIQKVVKDLGDRVRNSEYKHDSIESIYITTVNSMTALNSVCLESQLQQIEEKKKELNELQEFLDSEKKDREELNEPQGVYERLRENFGDKP
jgi:MFS superfamily sulfate permease-like transporter